MGASLKQLVEAAARGDRQASRDLIQATYKRLYRFALVLCGDPMRAEDLCQEAYIRAFASLPKLNKPESFMDWLFRVTRHLHIDEVRKRHADLYVDQDPEKQAQGKSEISELLAVHEVLSQFETEDRWLLMLVDMESYSYREAGEILGLSEAAVRSRVFRLRKEFVKKWRDFETK